MDERKRSRRDIAILVSPTTFIVTAYLAAFLRESVSCILAVYIGRKEGSQVVEEVGAVVKVTKVLDSLGT